MLEKFSSKNVVNSWRSKKDLRKSRSNRRKKQGKSKNVSSLRRREKRREPWLLRGARPRLCRVQGTPDKARGYRIIMMLGSRREDR